MLCYALRCAVFLYGEAHKFNGRVQACCEKESTEMDAGQIKLRVDTSQSLRGHIRPLSVKEY